MEIIYPNLEMKLEINPESFVNGGDHMDYSYMLYHNDTLILDGVGGFSVPYAHRQDTDYVGELFLEYIAYCFGNHSDYEGNITPETANWFDEIELEKEDMYDNNEFNDL